MAKVLDPISLGWLILSISMPTMDRGRFSSHFLLSVDKMCFPSSVCESFLKKCWRGQFYLKMAKALTRFFWWFILSISTPTMDRGQFSAHILLSVDKMCFPSSVSNNADVHNFISKWRRSCPDFFCDLSTINWGRFSSYFLLSVDKMCFFFFSMWEFSEKMLTCTILSQNGEGPDPIFFVIYPFHFNNPPGSIFQPLPSIRG